MSEDVRSLAGTHRRAVVAEALRARYPNRELREVLRDAETVLQSLDEDVANDAAEVGVATGAAAKAYAEASAGFMAPYLLTAEQQIRAHAVAGATRMLGSKSGVGVEHLREMVEFLAELIETGDGRV